MEITQVPVAKAGLLIRRPVAEVFEAFIDPAITSKFWFTKGSGPLDAGQCVRRDWEMFGVPGLSCQRRHGSKHSADKSFHPTRR